MRPLASYPTFAPRFNCCTATKSTAFALPKLLSTPFCSDSTTTSTLAMTLLRYLGSSRGPSRCVVLRFEDGIAKHASRQHIQRKSLVACTVFMRLTSREFGPTLDNFDQAPRNARDLLMRPSPGETQVAISSAAFSTRAGAVQERVRKDLDSVAGMSALALQQALTAAEEAGSSAAINMSLTEDESALAALRRMCASAAAATALGAADGSDAFSRKRHAIKLVRGLHLDVVVSRLSSN